MGDERVKTIELFRGSGGAITKNSYITSDEIDLRDIGVNGFFSLHMISVGGTIEVTVLVCSTKNGTYVAPTTAVIVLDSKTAGTYFESFIPPVTPFMKLRFTEENAAAVTSLDAWLNVS